jgi:hypothetical protein
MAGMLLQAIAPRLLDNQKNPGVGIGKVDNIWVMDLDELQEIGEDNLLWLLKPLLALIEDLDTGDLPGKFGSPATSIPMMLKGTSKSGENLDSSLSPHGKGCYIILEFVARKTPNKKNKSYYGQSSEKGLNPQTNKILLPRSILCHALGPWVQLRLIARTLIRTSRSTPSSRQMNRCVIGRC